MVKFPTIDSFFPPKDPSRSRSVQKQFQPGDGFTVEEGNDQSGNSTTKAGAGSREIFHHYTISALKLGMKKVSITGRVVNLWESNMAKPNSKGGGGGSGRTLFQVAIRDDTGIIEFRIWHSTPYQSIPVLGNLTINQICTIDIDFVAALEPMVFAKSNATVPLSISISEEDLNSHFTVCEENNTNQDLYRSSLTKPDKSSLFKLVPLHNFLENDFDTAGIQTLLCIKFIGARKKVHLKSGTSADKIEIGVFDETAEGILVLWGAMTACAPGWKPSETILLLTSPNVTVWSKKPQLTLTRKSLLEVDPNLRDTRWLREHASRLFGKPALQQQFPMEIFDWENRLSNSIKILYTLGDIDKYSRQSSEGTHVGFLSVIFIEVKFTHLYKRQMFLCGICCGDTVFSNTSSTACKRCEKGDIIFRLNPSILGTITDETGCINGGNMLVSDRAWEGLFGRPAEELVRTGVDVEFLEEVEHRMLFTRITLIFGWSSEIGKLAIWDVTN